MGASAWVVSSSPPQAMRSRGSTDRPRNRFMEQPSIFEFCVTTMKSARKASASLRGSPLGELEDRVDEVLLAIGAEGVDLLVVVALGFLEVRVRRVEHVVVGGDDVAEVVLGAAGQEGKVDAVVRQHEI